MGGFDLVSALRTAATARTPKVRRGLWVSFLGAYGLEAVMGVRPDALEWMGIDLQHGDVGLDHVVPLLRVAERSGLAVFPRMSSHAADAIGKVVDAGVQGVIVPGVESAMEATALVRAIRLPPAGARSTGVARTSLGVTSEPGPAGPPRSSRSSDQAAPPRESGSSGESGEATPPEHAGPPEPLLLPMVETAAGLQAAKEIVAVDGVDGVFVGPYDLSMSLGCAPGDEEVMNAIRSIVETARTAGKIVGMYAGRPDLLGLAPSLDLVAVDSDVSALRRGVADLFG